MASASLLSESGRRPAGKRGERGSQCLPIAVCYSLTQPSHHQKENRLECEFKAGAWEPVMLWGDWTVGVGAGR